MNQTCHSINRGVTWISIYSPFNEFYLHGQGSSNANDNSSLVKVNSDKERSFSDVDMISRIHNLCRIKMTDLNMWWVQQIHTKIFIFNLSGQSSYTLLIIIQNNKFSARKTKIALKVFLSNTGLKGITVENQM